jgi:hypothetical protein
VSLTGMAVVAVWMSCVHKQHDSDQSHSMALCSRYCRRSIAALAVFQTNTTVVDQEIVGLLPLWGDHAALGASCLRNLGWVGNIQRLEFTDCNLGRNGGVRLIADALVGNTTMDTLCVTNNNITDVGLADGITCIVNTTQLKTLNFTKGNYDIFAKVENNKQFAEAVEKNVFLLELPGITHITHPRRPRRRPPPPRWKPPCYHVCTKGGTVAFPQQQKNTLTVCLIRNKRLNQVDSATASTSVAAAAAAAAAPAGGGHNLTRIMEMAALPLPPTTPHAFFLRFVQKA